MRLHKYFKKIRKIIKKREANLKNIIRTYTGFINWTPISEQLPTEPKSDMDIEDLPEYIVMIVGATLPTTLTYAGEGTWVDWRQDTCYRVTAWMPLPKAYLSED